jgi:predicted ATPase
MLLNTLAAPLMYTKGYAAPETVEVYERAHQLCREVGESIHIFQALAGISTYHMVQGKVSYALTLAEEMIEPAERQKELGPIMEAHRLLGLHSLYSGSFRKAARHFQQVQDMFDPEQRQRWTLTYGQDHMMSSLILGSWALAALGHPDQSHAWRKRAISEAKKSRHCFSQAYASAHNLYTLYLLDEVEMIKEAAPGAISFSAEQGFPFYATFAQAFEGWAFTRRGNLQDGVIQMRAGIEGFRATGTLLFMPEFFVLLADSLGRIGEFEEAFQLIEKSLDQSDQWGERQFEADAHRVRAGLLLLQDAFNQDEAERNYVKAIEVARRQDAKLWELRAATGLARLWRDQGRKKEARELLLQVYGWFTEGFGVPTVQEANQTLNTLG